MLLSHHPPPPPCPLTAPGPAVPTPAEMPTVALWKLILAEGARQMQALQGYPGAAAEMKLAISKPSPEHELICFRKLQVCVEISVGVYRYLRLVQLALPGLVHDLVHGAAGKPATTNLPETVVDEQEVAALRTGLVSALHQRRALARVLLDVLQFALAFDELRAQRPLIMNDSSYYKRLLPRFLTHPERRDTVTVTEDTLSQSINAPNPALVCVAAGLQAAVKHAGVDAAAVRAAYAEAARIDLSTGAAVVPGPGDGEPFSEAKAAWGDEEKNGTDGVSIEALAMQRGADGGSGWLVAELLACFANSAIEAAQAIASAAGGAVASGSAATQLRTMTVALVLYDHVGAWGAYTKKSTARTRDAIKAAKAHARAAGDQSLLNVIKFQSRTLDKAGESITELLDED